ncbi:MAG: VCBS repeat-containing protein [Thermodesulfobacteriota bacterium]|nr:VCBS repeat-containing protein [Thermodesulfobacteriota bacterium]
MHKSAIKNFVALSLLILMAGNATAATRKLAIIPFTVNAEKDLSYLSQGIADMMGSRITAATDVVTIDMASVRAGAKNLVQPLSRTAASDFGKTLGADYVIYGSITMLGGHVSIDANVIDVAKNAPPAAFYRQADSMAGVIPAVNNIAEEIGTTVFAASPVRSAGKTVQAVTIAPQATVAPPVPSPYMHPEKLLAEEDEPSGRNEETPSESPLPVSRESEEAGAPGSPFVVTGKARQERGFWKSRDYELELSGIAVGDVDGDGMNEAVLIAGSYLCVRRMERGRFYKIAEYQGAGYEQYLGVDAVDTDGNGKAEIFVTCINKSNKRLCSLVCEVNGRSIAMIAENQPWYFRAKSGNMIAGQKKGMSQDVFLPGIYRLEKSGSDYVQKEKIPMPVNGVSVYDYAWGRLLDDGSKQLIVMDENDRLKVYSKDGEMLWKSREHFGGSEMYITTKEDSDNEIGERRYLSQRVFVADLNNDGENEVLTVVNEAVSGRLFGRFKHFNGLKVVCLGWDGLGLSEMWHTRSVSGYASDFSPGDIDNDGKKEISVVVVSAREAALSTPRSSVIRYDLEGAM